MISRTRSIIAAAACAALIALTSGTSASAQVFFPNPPCATVAIVNNTGCVLNLHFVTAPAGLWPPVIVVPAGGVVNQPVPAGGVNVTGIRSAGMNFYPFNPPPPPAGVACGAGDFWIAHVRIGPVPCCVDICALPGNCAIIINPSPPPPMCNP